MSPVEGSPRVDNILRRVDVEPLPAVQVSRVEYGGPEFPQAAGHVEVLGWSDDHLLRGAAALLPHLLSHPLHQLTAQHITGAPVKVSVVLRE